MNKLRTICCLISVLFSMTILHAQDSQWSVNPYDYKYDMTVYAKVVYEGTEVSDYSNYEIGAFVGNECRGVGDVQTKDSYTWVYLRVRSNQASGEKLIFKLYDKSTGRTSVIKPSQVIAFSSQGMIGKPSSPVTLEKPSYTLGDVNEDGKISVLDIVAIRQIISGQVDSNYNNLAADVNVDGKISVMDIVSVRQMIANKDQ
uniref:dockerin type I repeat-containing protein n=1 Tax=Prevotella sp. TaxID=59823 RepID=UPI004026F321